MTSGGIGDIPMSNANREFYNKIMDRKLADGNALPYNNEQYNPMIHRLQRKDPHYERNKAHICSFWLKGTCNRGHFCPFRHEKPPDQDSELAHQNIKDRYYGKNDPVAKKMLNKFNEQTLQPPEDTSIKSLYVGNVTARITETDLKDHFYYFGEIKAITMSPAQHCAFIEFTTRDACEAAAKKLHNNLIVKGVFLKIAWAKPTQTPVTNVAASLPQVSLVEGKGGKPYYPSMDPERLGSIPETGSTPTVSTQPSNNTTKNPHLPNWTSQTPPITTPAKQKSPPKATPDQEPAQKKQKTG
jgi:pre-mRNA-splicing factor RBM22/SLT11